MDREDLRQFLVDANAAGYAGGDEKQWLKEPDGSTTIVFEREGWRSHDNFFGGEPYGGRTVVFHEGKPVWMMVYYGWVVADLEANSVYDILRKALMQMPEDCPLRGPTEFNDASFTYTNSWNGHIDSFAGQEQIRQHERIIYEAGYAGGWVDRRHGV